MVDRAVTAVLVPGEVGEPLARIADIDVSTIGTAVLMVVDGSRLRAATGDEVTAFINLSQLDVVDAIDAELGQEMWKIPAAPGADGVDGDRGWAPVYALAALGDNVVLQLVDYIDGTGDKPVVPSNNYVGSNGLVDQSSAINLRGSQGIQGQRGLAGAQGEQGDPGSRGPDGATGPAGTAGADGAGVPAGGAAGQYLRKLTSTDFETEWAVIPTGDNMGGTGGGFSPTLQLVQRSSDSQQVLRLSGWLGTGVVPDDLTTLVGRYVGTSGYVVSIENAVGLRGEAGTPGTSGADGQPGAAGSDGAMGDAGWSPVFELSTRPSDSGEVLRLIRWVGGSGNPPNSDASLVSTPMYVGPAGLTTSLAAATNVRGTPGDTSGGGSGDHGWSPTFQAEQRATPPGTILRLIRWVGGTGTPPNEEGDLTTTPRYIGPAGFTTIAAEATNFQGPQGEAGSDGNDGATGAQGERGPQGDRGDAGPAGTDGTDGSDGATGPSGADGQTGPAGAQGIQGEKGDPGNPGTQGDQGEKGDPGDPGADGAMGLPGTAGDTGWAPLLRIAERGAIDRVLQVISYEGGTGAPPRSDADLQTTPLYLGTTGTLTSDIDLAENIRGQQGPQGQPGMNGAGGGETGWSPVYQSAPRNEDSGQVLRLLRWVGGTGTPPNSETDLATTAMYLGPNGFTIDLATAANFRGLQGLMGVPGPAGNDGAAGATGPAGQDGPTGPIGPEGPQGPQGTPGNDGAQGATGPEGPQGAPGTQGPAGPKGDQGDQGARGNDGQQGPQGDRGTQGPEGQQGRQGDQGTTGDRGSQGPPGDAGTQGTQGPQGPQGDPGATGPAGSDGATGPGVPPGGSTGQYIRKTSDTDFDTEWAVLPAGGGPSTSTRRQDELFSTQTTITSEQSVSLSFPTGFDFDSYDVFAMSFSRLTGSPGVYTEKIFRVAALRDAQSIGEMISSEGVSTADGATIQVNEIRVSMTASQSTVIKIQGGENVGRLEDIYGILFGGATGEEGPAGAQGSEGPQGDIGPRGPQGSQGERGPVGDALIRRISSRRWATRDVAIASSATGTDSILTFQTASNPDFATFATDGSITITNADLPVTTILAKIPVAVIDVATAAQQRIEVLLSTQMRSSGSSAWTTISTFPFYLRNANSADNQPVFRWVSAFSLTQDIILAVGDSIRFILRIHPQNEGTTNFRLGGAWLPNVSQTAYGLTALIDNVPGSSVTVTQSALRATAAAGQATLLPQINDFVITMPASMNGRVDAGTSFVGAVTGTYSLVHALNLTNLVLSANGVFLQTVPLTNEDGPKTLNSAITAFQFGQIATSNTAGVTFELGGVDIAGRTVSRLFTIRRQNLPMDEQMLFGFVPTFEELATIDPTSLTTLDIGDTGPGDFAVESGINPQEGFWGLLTPADRPVVSIIQAPFMNDFLRDMIDAPNRTIGGTTYNVRYISTVIEAEFMLTVRL